MNDLTKKLVIKTAKKYKAAAKRGGWDFESLVQSAWWDFLIIEYMRTRQEKWFDKLSILLPHFFEVVDGYPYLCDYPGAYEFEVEISKRTRAWMMRKVAREPELNLDEWGDLAFRTVSPQMELFNG